MAWEERTVEHMREEFVRRVLAKEASKAGTMPGIRYQPSYGRQVAPALSGWRLAI